jgi:hypothetical protein
VVQSILGITGGEGVTGEQGGKALACYMYSVTNMAREHPFLNDPVKWLKKMIKRFDGTGGTKEWPAQASCIEWAIKFYPRLVEGMAAEQEQPPSLDFDEGTSPASMMDKPPDLSFGGLDGDEI